MQNVEFMTKAELEGEVLDLRHKLSEMTARKVDWIDKIKMAPKRRRILKYMFDNLGRVCSRTNLHESMYDTEPETTEKIVDVIMCTIRKHLDGTGYKIVTHWGQGFSLIEVSTKGVNNHDTCNS